MQINHMRIDVFSDRAKCGIIWSVRKHIICMRVSAQSTVVAQV